MLFSKKACKTIEFCYSKQAVNAAGLQKSCVRTKDYGYLYALNKI